MSARAELLGMPGMAEPEAELLTLPSVAGWMEEPEHRGQCGWEDTGLGGGAVTWLSVPARLSAP